MPHVPGQTLTHYPMKMPMGNQSQVNPDSYHTTRSLCDDCKKYNLVSSFWATELLGSHRGSLTPSDIFWTFTCRYVVYPSFQVFHMRGCLSLLALPDTCFPFMLQPRDIHGTSSSVIEPAIDTKHSADSVPCTHTHVMRCLLYTNAMQLCHCTLSHAQCMKTSTWTFYIVHYTVYHGQLYLMHTISIHSFNVSIYLVILTLYHIHVNISHVHIST